MLRIRVEAFQGRPPAEALQAEFGIHGGSIGRTPDNTLTLPDPERHVSRVHATLSRQGDRYLVTDQGTVNPLRHNGQPLGKDQSAPLADGDTLQIGDYLLAVTIEPEPASQTPRPVDPMPLADPFAGPDPFARPDPFAQPQTPVRDDPFAQPAPPPIWQGSDPLGLGPQHSAAASSGLIPDDFNPFSPPTRTNLQPPILDPGTPAPRPGTYGPSIDDLFNLSGVSADPLALGGRPPASPLTGDMRSAGLLGPITEPDRIPELQGTFQVPRGLAPATELPQDNPVSPATGLFLSWSADGTPASPSAPPPPAPPPQPMALESLPPLPPAPSPALVPDAPVPPPPTAPIATLPPEIPAPRPPGSDKQPHPPDALIRAFLEGLGMPDLPLAGGMTPEFARELGGLLRESTQGTLDLLLARAMTKREIRADVTMILGKENNPLKFSPTVEVALGHLLAPPGTGFMAPRQAMRDAYADLRAHQFGFMAGMRAALTGLLARFDPQHLETRLSQKSMLDNLLPMNRRARLWDLFTNLYGDLAQEMEEDFQVLFGREFLRAYEEQVQRLREPPSP